MTSKLKFYGVWQIITLFVLSLCSVSGQIKFTHIDHKVNYLDEDLINVVEKLGFRLETIFYTPFKSAFFNKYLSQYCRYFVFYKKV